MIGLFVLVTVVDQEMILGLVSCPAIVHCTTGFVLQNGKYSGSGQGRGQGYKSGGA